jgi:hypothetical protein
MLTPHVTPQSNGTAHPESASKALARGHHALAAKVREGRKRHRSSTLYERGGVTRDGIDYQQRMALTLYGPDNLNADLN